MVTIARQQALANSGFNVSSGSSGTSIGGGSSAIATPSQVSQAISTSLAPNNTNSKSGGSTNPHDAPGYNPAIDPTSSAFNPNYTEPVDMSLAKTEPGLKTATNTPVAQNTLGAPTQQLAGTDQVPQSMVDQMAKATAGVDQLKQKYTQGLTDVNKSGVQAPSSQGAASAGVQAALQAQPQNQPLPASVETFLAPENPAVTEQTKQILDWLQPASERKMLDAHIKQLSADRAELAGLKTDLMSTKRIMAGTEQDIRDEVTKAGGFATDSQVQAMTIARNKTLVQKAQLISDQIQSQTDLVNSDISLIGDEKQVAAQQFSQRMSLLNYQQENAKYAYNATKDAYQNIANKAGYDGLYASLSTDPTRLAQAEQILGLGAGGLKSLAAQPKEKEFGFMNVDGTLYRTDAKTGAVTAVGGGGGGVGDGTIGGIDPKTMTKLQASPEYKTINGVLPALQALVSYKDAINKYGTAEKFSGTGSGELSGTYGNALAAWKSLAGLGALSGADFALAENAVPSTGFFKRNSTSTAKINASIDNAIKQAENLTQRLTQNYPQAASTLGNQLDQMKVISNPNKFKVDPQTGQVIELTDVK